MASLLLIPLLFLSFLGLVESTHFAYATTEWVVQKYVPFNAQNPQPRNYSMSHTFGYRISFGWYSPARVPNLGDIVVPGQMFFYPMSTSSTTGTQFQVNLVVETKFTNDDWFLGHFIHQFITKTGDAGFHHRHYFNDCCRLSSIRDRNNDVDWTVTGIMNRLSERSPVATGLPRVYVQQFYPLRYRVPFLSPSGKDVIVSLALTIDSTLNNQVPIDQPQMPATKFALNKTSGIVSWTPQVTGLYAVAFFVEEVCDQPDVPCADRNLPATPQKGSSGSRGVANINCCTRVPLDFIFQVDPSCNGQPNCVPPPYFDSPFNEFTVPEVDRVWYFFRGIEGFFNVCATVNISLAINDTQQTTHINVGTRPTTSSWAQVGPEAVRTCYLFKWAPGIADQDQYICASAFITPGYRGQTLYNQGLYCILLKIKDGQKLQAAGIIRDFKDAHPDFNVSYSDCRWCSTAFNPKASNLITNSWVASMLDANHKPVYAPGTPVPTSTRGTGLQTGTAMGFYDWYTTDPAPTNPRNLAIPYTVILSSGASLDQAVYTFLSSSFFPIDNQGFGNEGADHNYYYTFEVNMYITYYGSLKLNTAANDDLWIFIDDVLPANWNQHGIKPMMPNGNPYNFTIDMDTLLDHDNAPLKANETYRCDMFYANRYGVPYLMIEVPNNTLCSQLSSGKYAINLTDFGAAVPLVDGSVTNAVIPANGFFYVGYSGQYAPSKGTINRPAAPYGTGQANWNGLKIFDQRSQGSAVCWGTPLKALHGFIATFTWFVNNPSKNELDGFAFMLVSYPFYRGGAAGSLGYGGLQRSLAVEFDMAQTALLSDPDFTVCCGDYPIWDVPQAGWTMKPYGQVSTHAKLVPNAGGSYPGNSADENPSTGGLVGTSSQGRIFLDFRNGTEYKTKIIYQPALDDGTNNVQLGWLWTYINKQLEPINAVQLDGVVLRNMLGGATTFCWTSGGQWVPSGSMTGANPAGYGADIWMLDLSVLIVPTDAGSTVITKAQIIGQPEIVGATSPISPMVAGQTSTVTVQAKDACGNPITVGGELDLFTCNVVKETCPGAPVVCNGTDNGDGTYTFSFRPTIAATNYLLYLSFGPVGDVRPLKGSPYRFIVEAAPASIDTSIAVFGQLPELYSNAGNDPFSGDLRSEGVFAVRFSRYGRVVARKMFDFANPLDTYNGNTMSGAAGLNTFIQGTQTTEYLVIATSGSSALPALLNDATLTATMNSLSPPGNEFRNVVAGNAYTLIARKGGAAPTCTPCQMRSTNGTARVTTRGTDDSSISFTRMFTLVASSADSACGPWGIINSIFDDIRVPAGTVNQFTIQARDQFGNLNRLTNIQAAFSPDLRPSTNGDLVAASGMPLTGYFYYPFYSEKAGEFFMYASLNGDSGTNIRNGLGVAPFAPYRVLIDPDIANITNSYCQGPVLTTSTVGVWNTFQLVLYDRYTNLISFMNPADQISATLIYRVNHTVVTTLNTSWQDGPCGTKCLFYASFNTTIASSLTDANIQFDINVTINGYWKICGSPDIVPGPFFPGTTTFDVGSIAPVRAGTQTTFTIYTRDRFGNARRTPISSSDALYVLFTQPVTGYVLQYAGQGQYAVAATPTKKGDNPVQVIAGGDGNGDVKPAGNVTVGNQILKVIPGPAASPSNYTGISPGIVVRAGDLNEFIVTSYDKYVNLRDNSAYGISVANTSDYAYRFNEPTKGIEGMIRIKSGSTYATTGLFNFEYNATIIGTYRITVQTTPAPGQPVSQQIMGSPIDPVIVVPACTHPPSTLFGGAGLNGGVQDTQTNFTMTARDIFTNIQADFRDHSLYNVTISPPTTPAPTITDLGTPGNYLVKYQIPQNSGASNILYTIKVCHNGLNSTTGPVCYPSWCTNFTAYAVNLNRFFNGTIQVTNGSAGTPMDWNILDINATGQAASGPDIVTSWLVTVTRVGDSAPAAVAQPISIGTTEMLTGPTRVRTNVSFTPTINIGTFNVRVFAYGIETEQSKAGIQVTIFPGPVFPPNCVVTGLSATVAAGTSNNKFSVALKDEWFHDITDTGLVVNANLTHSTDTSIPLVPLTGTPNGTTWNFAYSLNQKGIWDVSIGETVSLAANQGTIGNNLKITVTPGAAVCSKSYVRGVTLPPINFATAGESVTFTVVPVDQFGNPVEDINTRFDLEDTLGDADFSQAVVSSAVPPAIEIQVTYLPRKVNSPNVLHVRIGGPTGCDVVGVTGVAGDADSVTQISPLNVIVYPADIYPPNSQAVATTSSVSAGNSLSLDLTLKDRFGNDWFAGRSTSITGFVTAPGSAQPYAAVTTDGTGAGKYVLTLSGQNTHQASNWDGTQYVADYAWEITANGVTISGASPLIHVDNSIVTAGPTNPANTLPPTLMDLTSDVPQTYQVTLRDQYGNIKYEHADQDTVTFNWIQGTVLCNFNEAVTAANASAITTVGSPTYAGNGVWNVTVLGTIVGSYTLNITVLPKYTDYPTLYTGAAGYYGQPNCGPTSRLLETVNPGPASPPHSWWTINKKVFNAGEKAIIFVQARDKQMNNIGKGGTPLSIGNKTVPASPSTALPVVGPELSTKPSTWTITPRTNSGFPWIDPVYGAADPTFPIAPGSIPPSGTVTDFGNSSYSFEITFWKSGDALPVVVGMLNASNTWVAVPWPDPTLATNGAIDVLPGAPQQFYPNTAGVAQLLQDQGTTAALPTSFTIHAYDKYGNPVAQDSNATFDIIMRNQVNGYEVPITADVIGGGATTFSFTSAWAGPFDLLITLHPGDGSSDITPPPAVVTIDHATCLADNPNKPYRCPDRTCVASYSQCPTSSLPATTCGVVNAAKVTCADGSCQDDASKCPCPGGLTRCVTGNCPASAGACPPANTCPSGYTQCPGTGQCRLDISKDCPSPAVCPPGYVVCPTGVNCGRNASDCPVPDTSLCTGTMKMCPDGSCATTATDCPTPITCDPGMVVCLTDGSCQQDAAHCPDQYPCFEPNTYRCPGTGLCTSAMAQCPSTITCKTGWVKCESGTCASSAALCADPITCGLEKVRCADGSCVDNTLFCPSVTSCADSVPVRCWDGNCVAHVADCSTPQACTTNVTCPGGSCSTSVSLCPTGTTCPTDKPVLCSDGSCNVDQASCTIIPGCPTDQPVRCPDGQSCRGSRTDCPTIVSCPIGKSVKCADGTCALAIDQCAPAQNCPTDLLRCPGGECIADTTALCPTHETCPSGYGKCLDGTCRTACPSSYQTCPKGQVTCPQAAAGVQCALELTDCPQQPTCPPGLPVRCFDASCATTVTNCPPPPTQFPNNKIPCGDGTWATSIQNCPTPLTCPTPTPAKCTDNTCRLTPADCSVPRLCPAATPYLCSSGACVANPWDPECTSSAGPCPLTKPVACAPFGSGICAENLTMCDTLVPLPLNCTAGTATCTVCGSIDGTPQTYCRNGACVNDRDYCPAILCDPSVPVKCPDGQCVSDASKCNDAATGCPSGLLRCPDTGMCTASISQTIYDVHLGCPTNLTSGCPGGAQICNDGSCPFGTPTTCPDKNGCGAFGMDTTKKKRCYDGTCVVSLDDCTSAAPPEDGGYPGMCQPANPYKCADGFCAKTSTACPPQLVNLGCKAPNTVQCATGICVSSALMCPPLNPVCPSGWVRCSSDASCRPHIETCPLYSECPHRCDNGICAPASTYCDFDEFTGCPGGMSKCANTGECVNNLASCQDLPAANGCPSTLPIKCSNGDCKATSGECMVGPSGACPQNQPLLCGDGQCSTLCTSGQTCAPGKPVRCADGTCAADATTCHTYNGCNGTFPYRCVDGSCAKQAATAGDPDSCPLSVLCSAGLTLCMDGGCVAKASLCTPLLCIAPLEYCNFGCYDHATCTGTSGEAPKCPSKSPILCSSGACVANLALCGTSSTGGTANTDCTGTTPLACAQGHCVASQSDCPALAAAANGLPLSNTDPAQGANANSGCGLGKVMCPNGECIPLSRSWACPIIKSCPFETYRWWNGKCLTSKSGAPSEISCMDSTGNVRCEDGWCREAKMGYDGCSNNKKASYLCANRNCAESPSKCNWVSSGNPNTFPRFDTSCKYQFGACRRLLGSTTRPDPCIPDATKECNAMIHAGGAAELIEATVDIYKTTTIPVALNKDLVSIASLTIPSGAFSLKNSASTTSISIRAVPASRMRYAVNEIVPSRRSDYGSYLDFPITVLSVPFECVLPAEVETKFVLSVTYTAWIDLTPPMIDYKDVCLARLVELQGFSTWECLISDRALRNVSSIYYVHKDGAPSQEVTSIFDSCSPSSAPGVVSPYNGSVYAFIFSPVPETPTSPAGLDVVQRNIVWIILGILLGIALLILLTYCAFRLFRYREKYHTEREEADRLQEEVENMKQFGGDSGNKDDQVAMTANPLAVQLKDVQARYNEEELKLQAAEASLRKQEGEIRAQHIENMRDNRNKLAQELEKLKSQLAEAQAASQPKATFEEHNEGPTYTGDEPVREEFDTGSTAVAPKRGKKDL